MNIKVTYHFRKYGKACNDHLDDLVFVEDDSNEQEKKEQIDYNWYRFHDSRSIVEYLGYDENK